MNATADQCGECRSQCLKIFPPPVPFAPAANRGHGMKARERFLDAHFIPPVSDAKRDAKRFRTAQGKRMLVLHGDRFDGVIACAKWLAYVGDSLYTMILKFNQVYNGWRACAGLPYWSLSQYLKLKVNNAVSYITAFEDALAAEARKKGVDGLRRSCHCQTRRPHCLGMPGDGFADDRQYADSRSGRTQCPGSFLSFHCLVLSFSFFVVFGVFAVAISTETALSNVN
jgi:hypothetical protein